MSLVWTGCKFPARSNLPSLKETYEKDDKNPFGGNVAFNEVLDYFENVKAVYGDVFTIDEDTARRRELTHSLYIIVSDKLFFNEDEALWLRKYIEHGNDLLISANEIDPRFLKLFHCETNQRIAHIMDRPGNMKETKTSIFFGEKLPVVSYKYFYYPFNDYLREYKEDETRVLGVNDQLLPNFAIIFYGKGRLYLQLAPRAFSNYFLLTNKNLGYLKHIVNYMRSDRSPVYWDEYYKTLFRNYQQNPPNKDFKTMGVIMKNTSLKWAFFVAVFAFMFFIFSGMKRKQRLIPLKPEEENASVDFVETLGRLYFVNKDNKNIATKLVTYFREHLRSKYFFNKVENGGQFATRLAAKSGLPTEQITELLNCIEIVEKSPTVSDEQLLSLNQQLENFYNKK